jgi:flagellin-specific chaperone FliS
LGQFVKALTGEEFDKVLDEIEDAMGLDIYRADAKDAKDELDAAKNRIKHLEDELEAERNRKVAPAEMAIYKHLYDELIDKLIDKKVL